MDSISFSELKRLTRPFATEADEADAERYWADRTPEERMQANERLLREFCRWRGIDLDKPMDKTIRIGNREEEDREHEEWHAAFEQLLRER